VLRDRKSEYALVGMTLLLRVGKSVPKLKCHPDLSAA